MSEHTRLSRLDRFSCAPHRIAGSIARLLNFKPDTSWVPKRRRGSITLEAALSIPVLLILFGSVSQVMILAQSRMYVEQAAYAAARAAMVYKCPPFDPVAAFKSPFAALAGFQCNDQPQKWEDAARWALIASSSSSEFASARGACPQ